MAKGEKSYGRTTRVYNNEDYVRLISLAVTCDQQRHLRYTLFCGRLNRWLH